MILASSGEPLHTTVDQSKAVGSDTVKGARTGMVIGTLAALTCGPVFYLCAPIGAAFYAGPGAFVGLAVGALRNLPKETVEQLRTRIRQLADGRDFQQELRQAVAVRAEGFWQLVDDQPDTTVTLHLERLALVESTGNQIALQVVAEATIGFVDESKQRSVTRKFSYTGSPAYADAWLANEKGFAEKNLQDAYRFLAENIVIGLSQ